MWRINCAVAAGVSPASAHSRAAGTAATTLPRLLFMRAFINSLTLLMRSVALLLFCAISSALAQAPRPTPSIVYAVHNPSSIKDYKTNPRVVREMVNKLLLAVTGESDVAKAWGSLVSPNDKIGIKICAAGEELFTTHHDVVNAIVDGLAAAGHPRSTIVVWDRSLRGIKGAGYRPGSDGYQLKPITPHEGYDAK